MAWGDLKPDGIRRIPVALKLCEFFLKNHQNANFPEPVNRTGDLAGVTITAVPVMMMYDDAREYVQKTISGSYEIIPHYYAGMRSTWQIIDDNCSWIMKNGKTGEKTIAVAAIISDNIGIPMFYNKTAFQDAARLTAYILHVHKLPASAVTFSKDCPEFITSRRSEFAKLVSAQYKKLR